MNHPKELAHTLQENSEESELYETIQASGSLNIEKIQIYDGPWIDIEVDKSGQSPQCSVRKHSRGRDIQERNLQIRFEFEAKNRLRILLGDLFSPHQGGQPQASELLSVVWNSDTGLDGNSASVCEEMRAVLAYQLRQILTELKVQIVRSSEKVDSSFNPREASEAAQNILTLRRRTSPREQDEVNEDEM